MPLPERASPLKMSRRRSLQVGAASAAAGLVTSSKTTPPAQAGNLPSGPATPAFMVELPVYTTKLPVASLTPASTQPANIAGGECGRPAHQRRDDWPPQKFYTLDVREALHSFHPNLPTQKIWGYDGIYPGPTFVARYGEPIIVRIYNNLPRNSVGFGSPDISTHLHNLHCGSESDGFAGDYYSVANYGSTLTCAGGYKDHHYPNVYAGYDQFSATNGDPREALGTLWYHDHRDGFTAPNVYKGMTGMYLLFDEIDSGNERDNNPKALRLPSGVGKYDIPLVFQDKQFDSSGYLFLDPFENDGVLGNKLCVNGKIQPFFKVERRKYRFRLLDGGPSRFYEFYLATADNVIQSFSYIANDGNLLPSPLTMSKVALAPAERADIVIDFSKYDTGTSVFLVNRLIQTDGNGPNGPEMNTRDASGLLTKIGTQILRFDIGNAPAVADVSQVPATLRALPDIDLKQVVMTRNFKFNRTNGVWAVNGNLYDGEKATAMPKRGTAEIWVLEGGGNWHHPVHVHFEEGRILTRNGKPPPPHEQGRKDVYVLTPGEVMRVFIRFRDFTGKYTMHCHNTIHEDHAMMIRYDIVE